MQVVPQEQYQQDMEWLVTQIKILHQDVADIKARQPDWVPLEEAISLTGRSKGWFYDHRQRGTLPITMQPRSEGNRRTMYSRQDCVTYGRSIAILPPAHLQVVPSSLLG